MSGKDLAGDQAEEGGAKPTFNQALKTWASIGVLSFGGPAAQIALMHRVVVDEKNWLSERQFLDALSFCMLLPGPEAMQLATYVGWKLHRTLGGLAAGLLFVLPGAAVVLSLAMVYALLGHVPIVEAVFLGIKATVLVIVIDALLRIARRALTRPEHWVVAAMSFVAIFFLALPYPLIVALAAVYGSLRAPAPHAESQIIAVTTAGTIRTAITWLSIWLMPLLALTVASDRDGVLGSIGWFFSKLAVVTFGGAYAVLAYMAQDVVANYGWLDAREMMDGLGLAETTPGPLILVTEFVGFLAAFHHGGEPAWAMGVAGAGIALWATFAPCFLWIFVGAPYLEWITNQPRLNGALTGITAAVVGFVAHLALWFALHVFFNHVEMVQIGIFHLWTPDLGSIDWKVVVLAAASAVLLLWRRWSIPAVLVTTATVALASELVAIW